MRTHEELLAYLLRTGALKSPLIAKAFRAIDRLDFLPERLRDLAYQDAPLPIGHDATISQPYVVAFMLELLQPQPGQKIMDIGSGSGWTTTLLAYIVSQEGNSKQGKVFAIERVPELKEFGERNCAKYNFIKKGIAKFPCQDGTIGLPNEALFDAIHVAAALQRRTGPVPSRDDVLRDIPSAWRDQLKVGGKIVTPIENSVWEFVKTPSGFEAREYPGFAFVPLIQD